MYAIRSYYAPFQTRLIFRWLRILYRLRTLHRLDASETDVVINLVHDLAVRGHLGENPVLGMQPGSVGGTQSPGG